MARTSSAAADRLSGFEDSFLAGLLLFSACVIFLSAIYYLWKLPLGLSGAVLVAAFVVWCWTVVHSLRRREFCLGDSRLEKSGLIFAVIAVLGDILLFIAYALNATDFALISPWQALPIGVFAVFFISTLFALLALARLPRRYALPLAILHSFAAVSASAFVYKLGFGFDPFIHEAATRFIAERGVIEPKTPFYIGQYVLATGLHVLTAWPIKEIQTWLVPTLSSILIPTALALSGRRLAPSAAWFLPFGYLTFTVPFNLAFVLAIVAIILLPRRTTRLGAAALVALSLAALAIHPLVGIPLTALVASSFFTHGKIAGVMAFGLSSIGLSAALALYTATAGGSFIYPSAAQILDTLLILFKPPFVLLPGYPLWSALYAAYYLWPFVAIALGVATFLRRRESNLRAPIGAALGVLLAAIISAASFRYRDVASYEQFEFAYRLLSIIPWFFLPAIARKLGDLKSKWLWPIALALMATAAWHAAYPQLNPIMHFHSPGVSTTDFLLVEAMERDAGGKSYAALVPQLTSAAALRAIGFKRELKTESGTVYPYAIPTGGRLYQSYLNLFSPDSKPLDELAAAFSFAQANLLYVAIPISWDTDQGLSAIFKKTASDSRLIDESVWLYRFDEIPDL